MTTVWFGHRRILTLASTLLAVVATVGGVAIAATPGAAPAATGIATATPPPWST